MTENYIKHVSGEEVKDLRIKVFSTEQGYPIERLFDSHENDSEFIGFISCGKIIGCCRLYNEPEFSVHIDNIAFSPEMRGKGFGKNFMFKVSERCFDLGYKKITINAKKEALGFYLKCGFKICGDEFKDENFLRIPVEKNIL